MSRLIDIHENQINIVLEIPDDMPLRLLHFSALPYDDAIIAREKIIAGFRLVELHATGENLEAHHGNKHVGTVPADKLRYVRHSDYHNDFGRKLEIEQTGNALRVISHFQFYDQISVVRFWNCVTTRAALRKVEGTGNRFADGIQRQGAGMGASCRSACIQGTNCWEQYLLQQ